MADDKSKSQKAKKPAVPDATLSLQTNAVYLNELLAKAKGGSVKLELEGEATSGKIIKLELLIVL